MRKKLQKLDLQKELQTEHNTLENASNLSDDDAKAKRFQCIVHDFSSKI